MGSVAPWVELGCGFLGEQALGFCALIDIFVRAVSWIDFFPKCRRQELTSFECLVNANGQLVRLGNRLIAKIRKVRFTRLRANNFFSAVKNCCVTKAAASFVFDDYIELFGDERATIARVTGVVHVTPRVSCVSCVHFVFPLWPFGVMVRELFRCHALNSSDLLVLVKPPARNIFVGVFPIA